MAYNTAVSALMILTNAYDDAKSITKDEYHTLLTLLNPIAPHITEELNESLGFKPICEEVWPKYDEDKTIDKNKTIGVQVNGKLRSEINVTLDEDQESIKQKALNDQKIIKFIEGKELIKVIVVPNKIVNIVIK